MTKHQAVLAALTKMTDSGYTESDVLHARIDSWAKLPRCIREGRVWIIAFHENKYAEECNTATSIVYVDDSSGEVAFPQDLINEAVLSTFRSPILRIPG